MFGFLNINKSSGPTSHDVVDHVRRRVGRDVKVGHAGTLDPFARGVLLVCLGGACRLADLVMGQPKRYRTTIRLGATSDTDDRTGKIAAWRQTAAAMPPLEAMRPERAMPPDEAMVREVLAKFVGRIQQVPPNHSAIFVQGRRAYKIARKGEELSLPPRPVEIHSIDLLAYQWPDLTIDIACGSGTYIRALARDIGEALGCGGYCQELERTAIGDFTLASAVTLEQLDPRRDLISPLVAVGHLPKVALTPGQVADLLLGRRVSPAQPAAPGEVAIVDSLGSLLALGRVCDDGRVQPSKVLVERK